jgi:hypothetical protein
MFTIIDGLKEITQKNSFIFVAQPKPNHHHKDSPDEVSVTLEQLYLGDK